MIKKKFSEQNNIGHKSQSLKTNSMLSIFMKNSGAMVGVATIVLVVGTVVSSVCPQFAKYEVMYYFKAFISLQPMNHLFAFSICAGTIVVFFILTTVKFRMLQIQK